MLTLTKPVEEYTLQDYFDIAWNWAVVEGHPKCSHGAKCLYRDANGNKCYIGAAIPDDRYKESMEGDTANGVLRILKMPAPLGILELQGCHDNRYMGEPAEPRLKRFAREYKLTIPDAPK